MSPLSVKSVALAATALFSSFAAAVQTINVEGSNFVTSESGDRFYMIGVDYQPGGSSAFTSTSDPLSDSAACLRDAILMQQLGVNTIRVYNLDADIDHNLCASIFNAAGIYMVLDVNSGLYGTYLDRTDPSGTYTLTYLEHIFGIIEAFAPFPNTLGFFAGNEIINQDSVWEAPEYIRAVVRDMKEYIANNIDRDVGVGYSAADVSTLLSDTWNYLGCELENSTFSKIDFFGLNDYEWCGNSSYTESGYDVLIELFEDTDIPVFFSEYGCNDVEPRTFTNVPVLYGDEMSVMSGGLCYEWTEESDDYGLVDINSTTEVTLLVDYVNLKDQFDAIDYSTLIVANTTAESRTATSCATSLITGTDFIDAWSLPARPSGGDALVSSGISSSNPGSLVSVTATSMTDTVYETDATTKETGLVLVILDADDSNYPGLVANYSSSGDSEAQPTYSKTDPDSNSSSTSTSSSSSSSSTSSSGASTMTIVSTGAVSIAVFVIGIFLL